MCLERDHLLNRKAKEKEILCADVFTNFDVRPVKRADG